MSLQYGKLFLLAKTTIQQQWQVHLCRTYTMQTTFKHFYVGTHILTELGTIMISILQMRRPKEVK